MITNSIVILSLAFAVLFSLKWLLRKDFRDQIERPKHSFQNQVQQYDSQVNKINQATSHSNELNR